MAKTPASAGAGASAPASSATLITPDGYKPPAKSQTLLSGVPFNLAARVGDKYTARFKRWDGKKEGKNDPSLCPGLYQFPNNVLFWESKMAVDADGATTPSVLKSSSGSQVNTSLCFSDKKRTPVNAEIVPYFVVPTFDDPKRASPSRPFEGSRDRFTDDFNLKLGNLGVVIFGDKITGAIFADEGPAMKIGEASIRVHELIRKPGAPWKGDPAKKILLDASEEKGVLYFVFNDTLFDIDTFGPSKQDAMAAAIQKAAAERFAKMKAP
jgi:hypothetical protein